MPGTPLYFNQKPGEKPLKNRCPGRSRDSGERVYSLLNFVVPAELQVPEINVLEVPQKK